MCVSFFFFKQKTAYEIGLGIPAEPLFRSLERLVFSIMRCLLINRRSLLLALRLLWKTPIFPSNSRFPRLCRSEERRVGKECRCRWSAYQTKKKIRKE